MPENSRTSSSGSSFSSFVKEESKKVSNGFKNFVNDMGRGFTDDDNDAASTSSTATSRASDTLTYNLGVSVEEVTAGCTKKLKISRKIHTADGASYNEDALLEVPIKKGLRAGSRITFPEAGDRHPGRKSADLSVIVCDKAHQLYSRDKDDLTYKCRIPVHDALCGCTIDVPLVLGGVHRLTIQQIVKPDTVFRIKEEGVPNNRSGVRGDMIVLFEIEYPTKIRPDLKDSIRALYR